MAEMIVTTKKELAEAKKKKVDKIIVKGELAEKMRKIRKISTLSNKKMALLASIIGAGVVATPFTGGFSLAAAAPAAAATGIPASVIITAATIGITTITALFLGYNVRITPEGDVILDKKNNKDANKDRDLN
jgi:multisubunit Na+/H+ antiporter MnhC subunit